jgi:hypothetical protein
MEYEAASTPGEGFLSPAVQNCGMTVEEFRVLADDPRVREIDMEGLAVMPSSGCELRVTRDLALRNGHIPRIVMDGAPCSLTLQNVTGEDWRLAAGGRGKKTTLADCSVGKLLCVDAGGEVEILGGGTYGTVYIKGGAKAAIRGARTPELYDPCGDVLRVGTLRFEPPSATTAENCIIERVDALPEESGCPLEGFRYRNIYLYGCNDGAERAVFVDPGGEDDFRSLPQDAGQARPNTEQQENMP